METLRPPWIVLLCAALCACASVPDAEAPELEYDLECCADERRLVYEQMHVAQEDRLLEARGEAPTQIGILRYDLNDDGSEDVLAHFSSPLRCDPAGCPFRIFLADGEGGYDLLGTNPAVAPSRVRISDTAHEGFRTLYFPNPAGGWCRWEWSGSEYAFGECETAEDE